MKRLLLVLTIAAMVLALTASPALGAAREPTLDGPGDPQTPENTVDPTKDAGSNCYGQLSSNNNKGPGGNPGSLAEPTIFDPDGPEGPEPAGPNYTGHAVSTLDSGSEEPDGDPGDEISGFQKDFKNQFAGESEVIDPDTGDAIC